MEINKLKVRLTKLLKNRGEYLNSVFLQGICKLEDGKPCNYSHPYDHMKTPFTNRYITNRLMLKPFYVAENDLFIDLSIFRDSKTTTFYNEINFRNDEFGRQDEAIELKPGLSVPLEKKLYLEIIKEKVRLSLDESAIFLTNDFTLEKRRTNSLVGVEFNFKDLSMKTFGSDKSKQKTIGDALTFLHYNRHKIDSESASKHIAELMNSKKSEKKLIETYRLDMMVNQWSNFLTIFLYHFIQNPFLKVLLSNELCTKIVFNRINKDFYNVKNTEDFNQFLDITKYCQPGKTPEEIANVDIDLYEFYEQFTKESETYNSRNYIEVKECFDLLKKQINLKTNLNAQYTCEAIWYAGAHLDYSKCDYLVYLVKCGFELEEIFKMLLDMDRDQSIAFNDGLKELYYLNFFSECKNGCRSKVVSNSVKMDTDRALRETKWMLDKKEGAEFNQVIEAFSNRLNYLHVDSKDIIISNGFSFYSKDNALDAIYKNTYELKCRTRNSEKTHIIYMRGLSVIHLSAGVPPKLKAAIREWAIEKGVHIYTLNAR